MVIMRLWNEISAHRTSAAIFAAGWLGVFAFTFLTWAEGMSDLAVSLHVASAVTAGALVGWWQFPAGGGLLASGWRPAGPPSAGAFVAVAVVTAVFMREALTVAMSGRFSAIRGAELAASWLAASAILGAIGLLCGLLGGMASRFVASHFKSRSEPSHRP